MKKMICVALMCTLLGCEDQTKMDENGAYIAGNNMMKCAWSVVDVKFNGKTHQYIVWWPRTQVSGIAHFPDCKYCKGEQ